MDKSNGSLDMAAGGKSESEDRLETFMDSCHISPSRHPMNRLYKLSKEEPYIHSVVQTNYGRIRQRRQSAPGSMAVMPMRARSRSMDARMPGVSRDLAHLQKLDRQNYIPGSPELHPPDIQGCRLQRPMDIEQDEAVGAVAGSPSFLSVEIYPSEDIPGTCRRRRRSLEPSGLAAIHEDKDDTNNLSVYKTPVRRLSTPILNM